MAVIVSVNLAKEIDGKTSFTVTPPKDRYIRHCYRKPCQEMIRESTIPIKCRPFPITRLSKLTRASLKTGYNYVPKFMRHLKTNDPHAFP